MEGERRDSVAAAWDYEKGQGGGREIEDPKLRLKADCCHLELVIGRGMDTVVWNAAVVVAVVAVELLPACT